MYHSAWIVPLDFLFEGLDFFEADKAVLVDGSAAACMSGFYLLEVDHILDQQGWAEEVGEVAAHRAMISDNYSYRSTRIKITGPV